MPFIPMKMAKRTLILWAATVSGFQEQLLQRLKDTMMSLELFGRLRLRHIMRLLCL